MLLSDHAALLTTASTKRRKHARVRQIQNHRRPSCFAPKTHLFSKPKTPFKYAVRPSAQGGAPVERGGT